MVEREGLILSNYLEVLRRRRNIVIFFFCLTVVIAGIVTFFTKPVYRATVTLLIDVESPSVLSGGGIDAGTQGYATYGSYREYYKSQMGIITSTPILEQVFKEFDLSSLEKYREEKEPLKEFAKTVSVKPVKESRLLKLNANSKDPSLAKKIANRIAEIYIQHNLAYISKSEWLNLLKNEYLRLKAKLFEYSKIYKESHPEMIRIKKEIDEVIENISRGKRSSFTEEDIEGQAAKSKYQQALEGLKANNVSIVAAAKEPVRPVKPNKVFNIMVAIIVGLFGGIVLAFFIEYQDFSIKGVDDLERIVDWPYLGQIPKVGGARKEFHVQRHPNDFISEAIRSIRTQVLFLDTKENPVKAVVVSSLGPQEGKTTFLCNLGIIMASNKKKILLVDSDMRKPRLHAIFKKKTDKGLSHFLAGQVEYKDIIVPTEVENLFFVGNSQPPPNPAELLSNDRMKEFIDKVKEEFDFILFDSPPISMITDATILSKMLDGVIVVVECEKTPKKALARSYKLLKNSRIKVLGVVIDRVPVSSGDGYYYAYSYSGKKR